MEGYAGYKKTNMVTYINGHYRFVYEKDGKLFYRSDNHWMGTYKEYCEEKTEPYWQDFFD
jgi:hypothetical protein